MDRETVRVIAVAIGTQVRDVESELSWTEDTIKRVALAAAQEALSGIERQLREAANLVDVTAINVVEREYTLGAESE